jgi:hypothetical protein
VLIVVLQVLVEKIVYKDVIKYVDVVVEREVQVPVEVERRVEVPVPYEKIVIVPPTFPNFPTLCPSPNFWAERHSERDACCIIVMYTACST